MNIERARLLQVLLELRLAAIEPQRSGARAATFDGVAQTRLTPDLAKRAADVLESLINEPVVNENDERPAAANGSLPPSRHLFG